MQDVYSADLKAEEEEAAESALPIEDAISTGVFGEDAPETIQAIPSENSVEGNFFSDSADIPEPVLQPINTQAKADNTSINKTRSNAATDENEDSAVSADLKADTTHSELGNATQSDSLDSTVNDGINTQNDTEVPEVDDEEDVSEDEEPGDDKEDDKPGNDGDDDESEGDHDKGHGNDHDGIDDDNPGQGGGGPNAKKSTSSDEGDAPGNNSQDDDMEMLAMLDETDGNGWHDVVNDEQDGDNALDAGGSENGWVETIEDDSGKDKGKKIKNKDENEDSDNPLGDIDNDAISDHNDHSNNDGGNIPEGGL